MLTDPALYALVFTGITGFYLFTVALQTGSVNGAAAALVVGETVLPGAVGILLLGDVVSDGWTISTALAFTAAVIGGVIVSSSSGVQAVEHGEAAAFHEPFHEQHQLGAPRAGGKSVSDSGTRRPGGG